MSRYKEHQSRSSLQGMQLLPTMLSCFPYAHDKKTPLLGHP